MSRSSTDTYFIDSWKQERPLPQTRPLALTTNFVWIVAICFLSLQIVPILVAWIASFLLR